MQIVRFLLALLCIAAPLRSQIIISEFLANNANGIVDENGNHDDWIELQNSSAGTVNLLGWYLTDDATKPRKWALPNMNLSGGGFLLVFASGKNLTNPAFNLHTNFKLSSSPGYLALDQDIAGGGVQVVQQFNPYPQQVADVSYGSSITTTVTPIIAGGATAKTLIPTAGNGGSGLGSTWLGAAATEPFNDSAWTSGPTPVGFPNAGVATTNLKLRLNANTASTIATDTSGAGHNGTGNAPTWQAQITDANGRTRHGAIQFNPTDSTSTGTGDQVVVPTSTADFSVASGTIMFWLKTPGNVADGGNVQGSMFVDRRSGTGIAFGMGIYLADDGTLHFQAGNGGTLINSAASTVAVKDNLWHHVALIFNEAVGGTCAFYIDGVAAGSQLNSGTSAWNVSFSQQFEIGRSHDTFWRHLNGALDDFRFYNTVLTPAQIAQIFSDEDEPVTPGTNVLATMQNVNASAFIRIPFNVADPTVYSSLNLTMKWNDGYVAWVNGTQVASFGAPASLAYNSAATQSHSAGAQFVTSIPNASSVLRAGTNVLAIQALNNSAAGATFSMLPTLDGLNSVVSTGGYLLTPTPRAANSAAKTNLGPFVNNVTNNPAPRPTGMASSPPLTIYATVIPSIRPLATTNPVQLKYAIMYASETSVNMTLTSTPNVYSATIPTSALGPGQMLRWRVVATDSAGSTGTAPEYSDPTNNEQYYGTVAVDSSIATNLPVFYWFAQVSTGADNSSGTRNSFFFQAPGDTGVGIFYDNVGIYDHGQSTAGFPKKSYNVNFNSDNHFEWSVTDKRVKALNLMSNWADKSKTHNTMSHEAFGVVGSVHHWCFPVRVQQVTPANAATPSSHFWSIAEMMEEGDDDFLSWNGLDPNGALYKEYDNLTSISSAEKKTRTFEDDSDLSALISGINVNNSLALRRHYAYDNMDLPQCVSYFVGLILTSDQDNGHKNFYVYRDTLGTGEWSILPWDVDLSWGRDWLDSVGYFSDTIHTDNVLDIYNSAEQSKPENPLYSLIVGNHDLGRLPATEFRDMVLRRLRTVLDGYFNATNVLENRFNTIANLNDPPAFGTTDADLDYAKWGTWGNDNGNTTGSTAMRYHVGQILNVYLPGRRTFLKTATLAGATVTASQPANAANLITIQTIDFNPSTGNQNDEFFVIRNSNTYPVDISGWQITGAVSLTFKPGTVIPPGAGTTDHLGDLYVAKNPAHFRTRTSVPDDGLAAANADRFVQGPYNGQLSARGDTIQLLDASGTLLRSKSWAPAPTAMQNQLRITEINYSPAPPTAAELAALPGVTTGDFEFIELTNIGATPLAMAGASFDQGISFTFPAFTLAAGARCLVVENLAAFQQRYGHAFDAQIAGTFSGSLNNSGETLELLDNVGEIVLSFTYSNTWYPPSDGGGYTLVLQNANAAWNSYSSPTTWALSGSINGSPGASDSDFSNVYEGWRLSFFTQAQLPTIANPYAPAALTSDPDGDSLSNLGEYAFGKNPLAPDNNALATASFVNVSGFNYSAITFNRRHKAVDLAYTVEATSDFVTWSPLTIQVGTATDLGSGIEQVTFRDNQPSSAGNRFLRVRAVK